MNRIDKIRDFSKSLLMDISTKVGEEVGWRYQHSEEVFKCALEILEKLHMLSNLKENELELIEAACLLHDIEKGNNLDGFDHHAEQGAQRAYPMLKELFIPKAADEIFHMIRLHDKRRAENNYSFKVKLLQDADILSKFNHQYVWRKNYQSGSMKDFDNIEEYHKRIIDVQESVINKLNFDESKILLTEKIKRVIEKVNRQYCSTKYPPLEIIQVREEHIE